MFPSDMAIPQIFPPKSSSLTRLCQAAKSNRCPKHAQQRSILTWFYSSRENLDPEQKNEQHLAFLRQLESQKGRYAGELHLGWGEADRLNRRALDLERQDKRARHAATERLHALRDAR